MEVLGFLVAIVLMAVGVIGTVVPIVPGTTIILGAAILHRFIVGPAHGLGWGALIALAALTLGSYALDSAAGYFGAKKFGATKWGLIGGVLGGISGIFFGLPGIFLGPVIGAFIGEFMGGRALIKAGRAGWGTVVGLLVGTLAKIVIGLAMVAIFVTNVPSPL